MRIFLSLCLLSIAAVAQAQLPAITDSALVKLIQGNVTWLTRVDSLKAYVNSGQAVASPTIQEETTSLTKRDTIRFVGAGITASDATTRTEVALDGDLNALAQLNSTGYLVRQGTDTYVQRSITASTESSSTGAISIASGNGVVTSTVISLGTQNSTTKLNVRAATTANITLTGLQSIDNMSLQAGDRCLVKNQNTATENGIYDVASGAWTRSSDLDGTEGDRGVIVFVSRGTINGNKYFKLETAPPITLGTNALSFSEVLGPSSITDGDKGDITVSASGATWTVDTAAITLVKMGANSVDSTKVAALALSVTDIGQHGATSGQVLKWNGSQWAPGTDNTGGGGGGSDGNGIYSGSDTIPNNTVATHGDYFGFQYEINGAASLEFDALGGRTSIYSRDFTSSISLTTDSAEYIASRFVFNGGVMDISGVTTKIGFSSIIAGRGITLSGDTVISVFPIIHEYATAQTNTTLNIPSGCKVIEVVCIGAGAGGGSGGTAGTGIAVSGGGGGGSGGWSSATISASLVTGPLKITVGAGGNGGAAVTTATGVNGNNGGASSVSNNNNNIFCFAAGGTGGTGGRNTNASGGGTGTGFDFSGTGGGVGSTNATGGAGTASTTKAPSGGGGGGGITSGNGSNNGGSGGSIVYGQQTVTNGGITPSGAGGVGILAIENSINGGTGGGGGGGGLGTGSSNGGIGGNGVRGGGGGGGGPARSGNTSGAGGNGGAGYVRITFY